MQFHTPRDMAKSSSDKIKSSLVATAGQLIRTDKSPDEGLGELFHAVQTGKVYSDGKTFADLIPKGRMHQIKQEYLLVREDPTFDLREFVNRHFYELDNHKTAYRTNPNSTPREHIQELWDVLERRNRLDRGSLVAIPNKYVVPGGRFSEQFYWDSYFIILGLAADGRWSVIEGMVKNCAYMIRKFGYIPTANRTYFLSRSQPPFFSYMVKLLAGHKGRTRTLVEYLPYMLIEHRFWMQGRRKLGQYDHNAYRRVAQMPNGILLNRYYDDKQTPRPESLREDTETASNAPDRESARLYLHLRSAAESGWDFSSRWFIGAQNIRTIHTADIIPVDLNCLLYQLEMTIAEAYQVLYQPLLARRFMTAAHRRAKAIQEYCWNEKLQFYDDYNFHHGEHTGRLSLAGVFPLYVKIADSKQAAAVARRIQADFLKPGGLMATLQVTGQQWDAPNGWAPLHWVAIQALRSYGYHQLAEEIKRRWIKTNLAVFKETGKFVEKYDVTNGKKGGGGEYPLQDGFGWTNGVFAALTSEDEIKI